MGKLAMCSFHNCRCVTFKVLRRAEKGTPGDVLSASWVSFCINGSVPYMSLVSLWQDLSGTSFLQHVLTDLPCHPAITARLTFLGLRICTPHTPQQSTLLL